MLESVTSASEPLANPSDDATEDYSYTVDALAGTLTVDIDHGGERTETRTFDHGSLAEVTYTRGTNSFTAMTRTIDGPTGLPVAQQDANANETVYGYDASGRLVSVTPPLDDAKAITYSLTASTPTVTEVQGSTTLTHVYDGLARRVETDSSSGDTGTKVDLRSLDALGRVERQYLPYLSADGAGSYADYTYDVLDRETSRIETDLITPATNTTTTAWNAYEAVTTNARGMVTTRYRRGDGSTDLTVPPGGAYAYTLPDGDADAGFVGYHRLYSFMGLSSTQGYVSQNRFLDGDDRIWMVTDNQVGDDLVFERNAAGDVVKEAFYPSGYNGTGTADSYLASTYDLAGRMRGQYFNRATSSTGLPDLLWAYDSDTQPGPSGWSWANPLGNLTGYVQDEGGAYFSYDDQNRVIASRRFPHIGTFTGFEVDMSYDYDGEGNLIDESLSFGSVDNLDIHYTHGPGGGVEAIDVIVTNGSGTTTLPVLTDATWHANGQYSTLTLGNGVIQAQNLDGLGRPGEIATTGVTPSELSLTYGYDENSNVSAITRQRAPRRSRTTTTTA